MILPFSTQLNGKPTYFVERIWEGLLRNIFETDEEYISYLVEHKKKFGSYWDWFPEEHTRLDCPKIHTLREDEKNRWTKGKKIDFFINCRQKDMFRFAPVLPVVSTQKVYMSYAYGNIIELSVESKQLHGNELLEFAKNDGFDTWQEFFDYFYPFIKATPDNWLERKIIHWTDKKY